MCLVAVVSLVARVILERRASDTDWPKLRGEPVPGRAVLVQRQVMRLDDLVEACSVVVVHLGSKLADLSHRKVVQ